MVVQPDNTSICEAAGIFRAMDDPSAPAGLPDPSLAGRLTRESAVALLARGDELLASGDYGPAAAHYGRVIGFDDQSITAAALLGLGEARYRLDDEAGAVVDWEAVVGLGETPSTYPAWRNLAAARVRSGDLDRALAAYREADRRAPAEDKAEIATRLGWLAKETGDVRASQRYFARGRGDRGLLSVTNVLIAVTVIVSLSALLSAEGELLFETLALDKSALADGEYWRVWSVTLLHGDFLHLFFNMYALYLAGPIVERWYGSLQFLVFYLACAAAGSVGSYVFGSAATAVGASGAVFGLFGVLLAAGRLHHPVDRQSRAIVSQIGILILINLVFGFASGGRIDNAAHVGGLLAGLWLGAIVPPTGVPTLSSLWQIGGSAAPPTSDPRRAPDGSPRPTVGRVPGRATAPSYVWLLAVLVVAIVVVAGLAVGTAARA